MSLKLKIEIIMVIALAFTMFFICSDSAFGQTEKSGPCGDGLYWEINEEDVLVISGSGDMYDYESDGEKVAPWNDYRLTIKGIQLPQDLTSIGAYAFFECRTVEKITVPDGVADVGAGAFEGCRSMRSISLPSSIYTIGSAAFKGCGKLTGIQLPSEVTILEADLFNGCVGLERAVMPDQVAEIGDRSFENCIKLSQITIPRSVRAIGDDVFLNCSSLEKIYIYCSVPSKLTRAFEGFSGVIYYPAGNEFWDKEARTSWCSTANWTGIQSQSDSDSLLGRGILKSGIYWQLDEKGELSIYGNGTVPDYDQGLNNPIPWSSHKKTISRITIEGISNIGNYMFQGCSCLETVSMRNSVTDIGRGAFSDCTDLKSIVLSEKLVTIEQSAFENCESLQEIELPGSLTSLNRNLLKGCKSLKRVEIPEGVTSIGSCMLSDCSGIEELILPESLNEIESEAFAGCTSLKRLRLPRKVKYMGDGMISGCTSLDTIMMKCRPASKFNDPIKGFAGNVYYNGNYVSWNEAARAQWAESANWIDNSKLSFDAGAYTSLNLDKTKAVTDLSEESFAELIGEIQLTEPEEFLINAKPSGVPSTVKTSEIKIPANLARAVAEVSGKLTVELVDGSYTLDSESLKGLLKAESQYIMIKLTDMSDYEQSIETYYNVEIIVGDAQGETQVTMLEGRAEIMIPVLYTKGAKLFSYADYNGERYSTSSYLIRDGLAVIGSQYVGDGGTQGKDWRNASMTLKTKKFVYDGARQEPGVKVFIKLTNGGSLTLKEGLHYSLNRSNWIKVGTRTVKASPLKNSDVSNAKSRGSISSTIRINPGSASVSVTAGAKKVTVKMSRPVSATGGSYYRVFYRRADSSKWTVCSGTSSQTKTISGLAVNKKYVVKVRAYTGSYLGAVSDSKTSGYIRPSKINSPSISKLSVSSSRASVYMASPSSYFTGIKYTAVYYKTSTGRWASVSGFNQHSRTKISFVDGKKGKKYTVRIKVSGYFHGKKYTSTYRTISYTAR